MVHQHNLEADKTAFADLGFIVTTGSCHLGGFVGEEDVLGNWLEEKAGAWADTVSELANTAKKCPQSACTDLQKSLQQEWQFVQRVAHGSGNKFDVWTCSLFLQNSIHDESLMGNGDLDLAMLLKKLCCF